MEQTTRKLATIRKIANLEPIPGADKIVKATVDGWQLVTAIDNGFKVGDLVIYLEIDSWVPTEIAAFLSKGQEPRVFNGVKGERLRTVKLRGQVSQGLIMPLKYWDGGQFAGGEIWSLTDGGDAVHEGDDVTEILGVQKYEPPVPANLAGLIKGYFPSWIRKTDQERVQNLVDEITESYQRMERFEVTRKMNGSSMTVYHRCIAGSRYDEPDHFSEQGVCSRNLDLKLEQEGNTFVTLAKTSGLLDALQTLDKSIAIQGELCGPGVQENWHGLPNHQMFVFDIFDIEEQRYLRPDGRRDMIKRLQDAGATISHVDVIDADLVIPSLAVNDLLALAEETLPNGKENEGLVWKSHERDFSFKTISNRYLLGGGE